MRERRGLVPHGYAHTTPLACPSLEFLTLLPWPAAQALPPSCDQMPPPRLKGKVTALDQITPIWHCCSFSRSYPDKTQQKAQPSANNRTLSSAAPCTTTTTPPLHCTRIHFPTGKSLVSNPTPEPQITVGGRDKLAFWSQFFLHWRAGFFNLIIEILTFTGLSSASCKLMQVP